MGSHWIRIWHGDRLDLLSLEFIELLNQILACLWEKLWFNKWFDKLFYWIYWFVESKQKQKLSQGIFWWSWIRHLLGLARFGSVWLEKCFFSWFPEIVWIVIWSHIYKFGIKHLKPKLSNVFGFFVFFTHFGDLGEGAHQLFT